MRTLSKKWDKTKHGLLELGEILILSFESLGLTSLREKEPSLVISFHFLWRSSLVQVRK